MPTTCSDFPDPKSLQIKQEDCRFFSKNQPRELSRLKSFEDYQGAGSSASVPFTWESQPGTPKLQFRQASTAADHLPPDLRPPPSYYSSTIATKRPIKKNSRRPSYNLLRSIFPSRKSRDLPLSPASSSSSSSFSSLFASSPLLQSTYSVPASPALNSHRRRDRTLSSQRLSFDLRMDEDNQQEYDQRMPISSFCFNRGSVNDRSRGCYSSIIKVLLREYE